MKKEFPKKWAYRVEKETIEQFQQILKKIGADSYWDGNSVGFYYMVSYDEPTICRVVVAGGYTPVTLQELQDHYLPKLAEVEEKKILGYKAPFDLFGGKVEKGTIYPTTETEDYTHPYFIPMEIVKTWEPVYAPEYKVGDFVFAVNDGGNGIVGKGEQLVKIVDNSFAGEATGIWKSNDWDYVVQQEDNYYLRVNSITAKFRKATEEEIKDWKAKQLPTIAGYTAEIINGRAEFGCVKLNEEYLKAIKYLLTSSANAKITVHDIDITPEMIDKLLKAIA